MDYTVHGILQARILEWVAFPFSRASSQPRDRPQISCIGRRILYQLSHKGSPRILEWVAIPFSSRSSGPRDQTRVSCIVGEFFTNWAMREALEKGEEDLTHWDTTKMPTWGRQRLEGCNQGTLKFASHHQERGQPWIVLLQSPRKEPALPAPWLWAFGLQILWEDTFLL